MQQQHTEVERQITKELEQTKQQLAAYEKMIEQRTPPRAQASPERGYDHLAAQLSPSRSPQRNERQQDADHIVAEELLASWRAQNEAIRRELLHQSSPEDTGSETGVTSESRSTSMTPSVARPSRVSQDRRAQKKPQGSPQRYRQQHLMQSRQRSPSLSKRQTSRHRSYPTTTTWQSTPVSEQPTQMSQRQQKEEQQQRQQQQQQQLQQQQESVMSTPSPDLPKARQRRLEEQRMEKLDTETGPTLLPLSTMQTQQQPALPNNAQAYLEAISPIAFSDDTHLSSSSDREHLEATKLSLTHPPPSSFTPIVVS